MKAVLRLSAAEGGAQDLLSDEPKLRASKAHLFTTQTAVDKVMWLKHRALRRERRRGGSLLVSSAHGGHIFFWDTHKGRVLGQFCAAHSKLGSEVCWSKDVGQKASSTMNLWRRLLSSVCKSFPS